MEQLSAKIGENLQRIRKNRGLSLDKLAMLTGVSKGMLHQIERGESNPTISVMWKIASGLHVSFTSLIQDEASPVTVVDKAEAIYLTEAGGNYKSYTLFPYDGNKKFEIYHVEMEPGCRYTSESHNEGVEEYLLMHEGVLEVEIRGQSYTIQAGSGIRFLADAEHTYSNPTLARIRYTAIIYYPDF
jgi:transcriptional regulator with XRE-family HTH domain